MKFEDKRIVLTDEDLKEIFSLFQSAAKYEKNQIYDTNSYRYFKKINLLEEYSLSQDKKEFALDAWRAIMFFLYSNGYSLKKGEENFNLSKIEDDFIG